MKILLSWLREFVDVRAEAEEIATRMSVRGFAVEGIEHREPESRRDADGAGADAVIDFEVTGNRPDCMSVMGMAREVAAAFDLPLAGPPSPLDAARGVLSDAERTAEPAAHETNHRRPGPADGGPGARGAAADLTIAIDNPELCGCYVGAIADVTMGPSPDWMQARLRAGGVRPISNIVDVTNYVLLEMGQPMHAFDITRLGGAQIRVRTARAGERITTLDGQDRALATDMLVIADASRPVAIAGVMGGADSEVHAQTTRIVFESAYFDPLSVRRTSRRLGLKTEASMRFERGIDRGMAGIALRRACALVEQIGAGRAITGPIVAGTVEAAPRVLELRRERIRGVLGVAVPDDATTRILERLGFRLAPSAQGWSVTVPPRRVDIAREIDLIEEVARHHGFDRIPATFPALRAAPPPADPAIARGRRVRHAMTGLGFSEAVTFGFVPERAAIPFAPAPDALVHIRNPLSEAFAVLRPSLLPGLVEAAAVNVRRGRADVRLFEAGSRFLKDRGERRAIAYVWAGAGRPLHWSERPRPVDFFDAKGAACSLALAHDVDVEVDALTAAPPYLARGQAALLFPRGRGPGTPPLGVAGQLAGDVAESFGLPGNVPVFVAELDAEELARHGAPMTGVAPIPRFPAVVRDISIQVDARVTAASLRATITAAAGPLLEELREFDRYQGKGIPEGQLSLSLRLTFRAADRTLTDDAVQASMDAVLAALREEHAAVQR